jgi:hypothetical protein
LLFAGHEERIDHEAWVWSRGRVLLYLRKEFLREERLLRVIGSLREVKVHDLPKRPPSLFEWESWSNDTIQRDGEDMEPNKPRLGERGQKREVVSPELRAP